MSLPLGCPGTHRAVVGVCGRVMVGERENRCVLTVTVQQPSDAVGPEEYGGRRWS